MDHDAHADAALRLDLPGRMLAQRRRVQAAPRALSIEQALIVTASHREDEGLPRPLQRARAFARCCRELTVGVAADERIVGNRTRAIRAGVAFPEAAVAWLERELDDLPHRPQDPFAVDPADARRLREEVFPYWRGRTLEDAVYDRLGPELIAATPLVKINQRDHAQGHIIPDLRRWLELGPAGIQALNRRTCTEPVLRRAVDTALHGMRTLIRRHGAAAAEAGLADVAAVCVHLADQPPRTFHQAVQAVWFLLVGLHLESNASSFSPGRLDQVLLPYYRADLAAGRIDAAGALELIADLFLACNRIVYLRNRHSAQYFAGFPIGFNIAIGGVDADGRDATNELSWLFLRAQALLGLPQPNLTARVHAGSPRRFLVECARVIGLGSGMPQIVSDGSIVPALVRAGLALEDARDYGVVGCVELAGQGNFLGWSDAAMLNVVKALELALNDGCDLRTGARLGPACGTLAEHRDLAAVEAALGRQIDHAVDLAVRGCAIVDRTHAEAMPSPLLSSVVQGCLEQGRDVTAGGARYNHSGIQVIQVANVADSLAAIDHAVFRQGRIDGAGLLAALRADFAGDEPLRRWLIERCPKYGNDDPEVDALGACWAEAVARRLGQARNVRGGPYVMGLYTVSAHVPMGVNVAATPDGRHAGTPLADGGLSPMYGRDRKGPTAVLRSVARMPSHLAPNGTLLNMKFLPGFFADAERLGRFADFLRAFAGLGIHHVQFNVLDAEDLRRARENPEEHRHLTVRVAGYTAYFIELADDLQEEIIARTAFGG